MCATDIPVTESLTKYQCCKAPFSRITFALHLRRKPLYFVIHLVIPCCFFSLMAAATFILQPNCSERLGLSKNDCCTLPNSVTDNLQIALTWLGSLYFVAYMQSNKVRRILPQFIVLKLI